MEHCIICQAPMQAAEAAVNSMTYCPDHVQNAITTAIEGGHTVTLLNGYVSSKLRSGIIKYCSKTSPPSRKRAYVDDNRTLARTDAVCPTKDGTLVVGTSPKIEQ